jgi:subtilisin family serine protease
MKTHMQARISTPLPQRCNKISSLRSKMIFIFQIIVVVASSAGASASAPLATRNQNAPQRAIADQYLIKVLQPSFSIQANLLSQNLKSEGARVEKILDLGNFVWLRVHSKAHNLESLSKLPGVVKTQKNFAIGLLEDYRVHQGEQLKNLSRYVAQIENRQLNSSQDFQADHQNPYQSTPVRRPRPSPPQDDANTPAPVDNPDFPLLPPSHSAGKDPLISSQWGMQSILAPAAWDIIPNTSQVIVAVIDTGVDYTHEDLIENIWINQKEIPNNGIDDDHNGYVDDVIGWDFASNDNKPFDLTMKPLDILFKGGNPGHGTHCAGNVAARGSNGIGISGVAPFVKIMPLRFITEKGQGDTAGAVKAIQYAVDNGAQILSNSWGGEGNPNDPAQENTVLKDAIEYARAHNVLFVAAAGNGRNGAGFNNDSDPLPVLPASYDIDNIVTVAAIDRNDQLGAFSNWGPKHVHIGAPGVEVFSTMVNNRYSDVVIDKLGFRATWNGTSMAAPHVAGAAALYLSIHPGASYLEIKNALIQSATPLPALESKVLSNGKLNVRDLLR